MIHIHGHLEIHRQIAVVVAHIIFVVLCFVSFVGLVQIVIAITKSVLKYIRGGSMVDEDSFQVRATELDDGLYIHRDDLVAVIEHYHNQIPEDMKAFSNMNGLASILKSVGLDES